MSEQMLRALRVMDWADLHGDDLAGALRLDEEMDAETIAVVNDALLAAGDAYYALLAREELALSKAPSGVPGRDSTATVSGQERPAPAEGPA